MLSQYVKKRLSFNMAAPGILGSFRKSALLIEVVSRSTAIKLGRDVVAMHARLKSSIPNLPNNSDDYMYGRFSFPDGSEEIIGDAWIVADSVKVTETRKLVITVDQDVDETTEATIRAALSKNGIKVSKIDSIV